MSLKQRIDALKEEKRSSISRITAYKEGADKYYKMMKKLEKDIKELNYVINILEQYDKSNKKDERKK